MRFYTSCLIFYCYNTIFHAGDFESSRFHANMAYLKFVALDFERNSSPAGRAHFSLTVWMAAVIKSAEIEFAFRCYSQVNIISVAPGVVR